jgi:hypothetical protein
MAPSPGGAGTEEPQTRQKRSSLIGAGLLAVAVIAVLVARSLGGGGHPDGEPEPHVAPKVVVVPDSVVVDLPTERYGQLVLAGEEKIRPGEFVTKCPARMPKKGSY